MKKSLMCVCTIFVFFMAAAVAQTNAPNETPSQASQGTQSSSPSMSQGTNPGGTMAGDNTTNSTGTMKTEKKMKGCIQSQGSQYVLQTKHGKDIMLSGQDVSAHVGHEVTVNGMWESGASDMSNTSAGGASPSGKSFNVTSVDMISETCSMGKHAKSGMSGDTTGTTGAPSSTTPPQ